MTARMMTVALALASFVIALPVAAQKLKPASAALSAYVKSHSNVETVIRPHVMAEEQRVGTNCAGPYNLAVLKVEEYEPVSLFDNAAHPAGGVWVFNVLSQRCGGAAILNFLQIAQNGRPPRTVAMLPGTTLTDPKLQRDTLRSASCRPRWPTMSR